MKYKLMTYPTLIQILNLNNINPFQYTLDMNYQPLHWNGSISNPARKDFERIVKKILSQTKHLLAVSQEAQNVRTSLQGALKILGKMLVVRRSRLSRKVESLIWKIGSPYAQFKPLLQQLLRKYEKACLHNSVGKTSLHDEIAETLLGMSETIFLQDTDLKILNRLLNATNPIWLQHNLKHFPIAAITLLQAAIQAEYPTRNGLSKELQSVRDWHCRILPFLRDITDEKQRLLLESIVLWGLSGIESLPRRFRGEDYNFYTRALLAVFKTLSLTQQYLLLTSMNDKIHLGLKLFIFLTLRPPQSAMEKMIHKILQKQFVKQVPQMNEQHLHWLTRIITLPKSYTLVLFDFEFNFNFIFSSLKGNYNPSTIPFLSNLLKLFNEGTRSYYDDGTIWTYSGGIIPAESIALLDGDQLAQLMLLHHRLRTWKQFVYLPNDQIKAFSLAYSKHPFFIVDNCFQLSHSAFKEKSFFKSFFAQCDDPILFTNIIWYRYFSSFMSCSLASYYPMLEKDSWKFAVFLQVVSDRTINFIHQELCTPENAAKYPILHSMLEWFYPIRQPFRELLYRLEKAFSLSNKEEVRVCLAQFDIKAIRFLLGPLLSAQTLEGLWNALEVSMFGYSTESFNAFQARAFLALTCYEGTKEKLVKFYYSQKTANTFFDSEITPQQLLRLQSIEKLLPLIHLPLSLSGLKNYFNQPHLSDMQVITSNGVLLHVHRCVLALSPTLVSRIPSDLTHVVELNDYEELYLRFLYNQFSLDQFKEGIDAMPFPLTLTHMIDNEMTYPDVTLSAEGRKIRAHKVLLMSASSYFHAMFEPKMKERYVKEIIIEKCSYEALRALLEYFYTGFLPEFADSESETNFSHLLQRFNP